MASELDNALIQWEHRVNAESLDRIIDAARKWRDHERKEEQETCEKRPTLAKLIDEYTKGKPCTHGYEDCDCAPCSDRSRRVSAILRAIEKAAPHLASITSYPPWLIELRDAIAAEVRLS